MKQKIKICAFARHTLISGLLFPAVVCLTYLFGLFSGAIETAFRYDIYCLTFETAKIYATCAAVAIACAFLAQCLYRERA